METGRNQIFLSASKAQAHVFKQYIAQFAREAADVDLTGDPVVLPNEAILYFLGTNARPAQSYHGNFYFDEYFWVPKFRELNKVASGMAMHKRWRKTYFSTPSSVTHEALGVDVARLADLLAGLHRSRSAFHRAPLAAARAAHAREARAPTRHEPQACNAQP